MYFTTSRQVRIENGQKVNAIFQNVYYLQTEIGTNEVNIYCDQSKRNLCMYNKLKRCHSIILYITCIQQ